VTNWSESQNGSGDFPFSEVEMRHLAHFIHSKPKIFGIMGYHTGVYCVLRLGSQPNANAQIDEADDVAIQVSAPLKVVMIDPLHE
jgi:hypothetical protein